MLRFLTPLAVCLATLVANGHLSIAAPITYRFSGVADGDLNGVFFEDAEFIFTLIGDTTDVSDDGGGHYSNSVLSATFSIAGVGSGTLLDSYGVFSTQPLKAVGFSHLPDWFDRVDVYDTALALYDLTAAIGPVSGDINLFVGQFNNDPTTAGALNLYNATSVSFRADAASAVPEPATLTMAGLGVIGMVGGSVRRRRRR